MNVPEKRLPEILLRIRAGAIDQSDATDAEIEYCVNQGLAERVLPQGITITAARYVSEHQFVDFNSMPNLHLVELTPSGKARLEQWLESRRYQTKDRSHRPRSNRMI